MNDTIGGDMAMFNDIVSRAQVQFPQLTIKYKDQSSLMKILAKILFFNDFMNYTTSLGNTIYLPSEAKVKISPVSSAVVFMHELSHIYDSKSLGLTSNLAYLFPQILALLSIPVFFILGFFPALICLLFLLPLPAYFRMQKEKQAYTVSLYVMNKMNHNNGFNINLDTYKETFISEFSSGSYYFMWPFPGIRAAFEDALGKIQNGEKPTYSSELYEMIDKVLEG